MDVDGEVAGQTPARVPPGRLTRARARAERAADRYQQRAQTQPLWGLPLAVFARYSARQGVLLASAVAFRLFLCLVPLSLLIAGVLAGFSLGHERDLRSAAKTAGITGAASQQVVSALRDGNRAWGTAVVIGALLFIWTTRTLIRTLTVVSAHAWQVSGSRRKPKDLLLTVLLIDLVAIVVLASSVGSWALQKLGPLGVLLAVLAQGLVASVAWFMVCRRMPNAARSWADLVPGSLLLGYSFSILNVVSRLYLPSRLQASSQLYGSLGVALSILAWLLILGQVIVMAALVNSVWADYRRDRVATPQG